MKYSAMPFMFANPYVSRMPLIFPGFGKIWKHKGHSVFNLNVQKRLIIKTESLLRAKTGNYRLLNWQEDGLSQRQIFPLPPGEITS